MPTPRKPDWAERKAADQPQMHESIRIRIAHLLRREHARAVRVVMQMMDTVNGPTTIYDEIYKKACADILAALKRGRT